MTKRTKVLTKAIDSDSVRKRRGQQLALIGGAVLLASFATQNFLFDRWNGQIEDLHQAMLDRAVIDKGTQLSQVLHFIVEPNGRNVRELREAHIREAARKLALSTIIPISFSQRLTVQTKTDMSNTVLRRASSVSTYDAFLAFVKEINDLYDDYFVELNTQAQRIGTLRGRARWAYLGLYVVGSFVLLAGIRYQ